MANLGIMERARKLLDAKGDGVWSHEVQKRRSTNASDAKRPTGTTRALRPAVHSAFSPSSQSLVRVDWQPV